MLVACAVLTASGCGADAPVSPDPLDPLRTPRLSVEEVARIGGDDFREDDLLAGVRDAALLPDRSVAVAVNGVDEVRVFDADGEHRLTLGGSGRGPGEFMSTHGVAAGPDGSVVVWDPELGRLTYFGPEGGVERIVTVTPEEVRRLPADFVGVMSDGSPVIRDSPSIMAMRNEPPGIGRDTIRYLRYDADREGWGAIVSVPGPERALFNEGGRWGLTPLIFGRTLIEATVGDRLVVGRTDSLRLLAYRSGGERVEAVRRPRPPRSVDEEHVRRERERRGRSGELPPGVQIDGFDPGVADWVESVEAKSTLPAFADFIPAGREGLWIRDFLYPGEDVRRWFRVAPDLEPSGWFEVPETHRALAADERRFVFWTTDSLDVETLVVLSVGAGADGEEPASGGLDRME